MQIKLGIGKECSHKVTGQVLNEFYFYFCTVSNKFRLEPLKKLATEVEKQSPQ